MSPEVIKEIIMKLTGDIHPVGATHIDNERSVNLNIYIELISLLTDELYNVAWNKDDDRKSVSGMGNEAFDYLKSEYKVMSEAFPELLEEQG